MSRERRLVVWQWLRRGVQGACLALFLWLVLLTRSHPDGAPGAWLQTFFLLDPLLLLGVWLSAHAVPALMLLSLITVVVTLLLGRVFCGWVCPLGTINAMAAWFRRAPKKVLIRTETWSAWQRGKYYLLLGLVVMALFGANWIGVFDPFSLLYRSTALVVAPAAQYSVEESATNVYRRDPALGPLRATQVTEPVYRFFRDHVFVAPRQAFEGAEWIAILFVLIVALNLLRKRFWCRYLCPLGALLGLLARRPMLHLANDPNICGGCNLCAADCQGAADPHKPGAWRSPECFACWNCVASCPSKSLKFSFTLPWRVPASVGPNLKRRAVLATGVAGIGGLFLMRLSPQAQGKTYNPDLIRPPGALAEPAFLQRCIQCGLCMKACPTNALQPTLSQAGLEGVWTPVLKPLIGYCEHNCNLCGQVCPTGAIAPLTLKEKQEVKMGLAYFDFNRCLPYAYARECIVCEEHCPTSTKAIYFEEVDVRTRDGGTVRLKQPKVDPERCIGCGVCENKCPFKDLPAIRVTSANETRHPGNQPILPSFTGGYGY